MHFPRQGKCIRASASLQNHERPEPVPGHKNQNMTHSSPVTLAPHPVVHVAWLFVFRCKQIKTNSKHLCFATNHNHDPTCTPGHAKYILRRPKNPFGNGFDLLTRYHETQTTQVTWTTRGCANATGEECVLVFCVRARVQVYCGFAKKRLSVCIHSALKNASGHVPFDLGPLSEFLRIVENVARRVWAPKAPPTPPPTPSKKKNNKKERHTKEC